jgi:Arc/MetJ-type ribon-helix-helix transcriptional regulator
VTVLKPRTRLISFRLSDEEYRELAKLCASRGARSLSEFLRSALLKMVGAREAAAGLDPAMAREVRRLRRLVKALDSRVNGLCTQVQTGPEKPAGTAAPGKAAGGEGT